MEAIDTYTGMTNCCDMRDKVWSCQERAPMFENDRLDRLFETLRGTAPLPSKHLAQALGVSERTLRNDISKLNNKLATCGAQISTKWHEGYYLEVLDNSAFDAFLTSTQCASSGPVLDTTDDRIRLMLTTLLLARGSESVSELARTSRSVRQRSRATSLVCGPS